MNLRNTQTRRAPGRFPGERRSAPVSGRTGNCYKKPETSAQLGSFANMGVGTVGHRIVMRRLQLHESNALVTSKNTQMARLNLRLSRMDAIS